jgi:hypothetical protein
MVALRRRAALAQTPALAKALVRWTDPTVVDKNCQPVKLQRQRDATFQRRASEAYVIAPVSSQASRFTAERTEYKDWLTIESSTLVRRDGSRARTDKACTISGFCWFEISRCQPGS